MHEDVKPVCIYVVKTTKNKNAESLSDKFPYTLTLPVPCISESRIEVKINSNFYFHTSLWCLKRF